MLPELYLFLDSLPLPPHQHFPHLEEAEAGKEEAHSMSPSASDLDASSFFGLPEVE